MTTRSAVFALALVVGLLALPISYYLSYLILLKIGADALMWFLWWFSIPLAIALTILDKIIKYLGED